MAKSGQVRANQADLDLAARFISALYAATRGRPGRFRRIADVAERAGIGAVDVDQAVKAADRAGFLVVLVSEPRVMLTEKGLAAARAAS